MLSRTREKAVWGLGCLLCFSAAALSHAKPSDLPLAGGVMCEGRDNPEDTSASFEEQVRTLYETGERCRNTGDLAMARTCYEEVHLLSPTSCYGQLAIQRLSELDMTREGAEEQEEPPPAPAPGRSTRAAPPQKMHPLLLGLVEKVY